jgi:hypothetical protein
LEAVYSLSATRAVLSAPHLPAHGSGGGFRGQYGIIRLKLNFATFRTHRQPALISFLLAFIVALLVTPVVANAQGGDSTEEEQIVGYVILGEEIAGPHIVQVQVSPGAPLEGIVRFAVRVMDLETGEDVDNAIVRVFGTPSEQGEKQYSPALNSPFDPIFYLSQLEFEGAGIWAIDVEVDSELGSGTTVLSLRVNSRTRGAIGSGWGTVLYLIVTLAFVAGGTWLWYSSKKARQRRGA